MTESRPKTSLWRRLRTLLALPSDIRVIAMVCVAVLVVSSFAEVGIGRGSKGGARSTTATAIEQPAGVGLSPRPGGWQASADGSVWAFGGAVSYGSTTAGLNDPIVGIAATPHGGGYWLVASDGGVFALGDAGFYGSLGNIHLNRPIVGMAATPRGHGYWLVASDGGVFALGDAGFYGSLGNIHLNRPIVGMAATPDGHGYWLVASDGGIFAFGDAGFYGSEGGTTIPRTIVGMGATPDGRGYWMDATNGALYAFGDAPSFGSIGGQALNHPIVGMASVDGTMIATPPPTTTTTTVPPITTSTTTPADPFVTVCGTQLCLHGQPWYMSGGTAYGNYGDPTGEATLLTQGNMNTSELVNFDSQYRSISYTEDSTTWNQVEAYIGQMGAAGHHVMLNFSEFFAAMETAGMNPFSPTAGGGTNFSYQEQYLEFVADQSVNGVPNSDDPTIAKVELWGEPVTPTGEDCISSPCQVPSNPQAMLTWYSTLEAYWHSMSSILISSGGFSHLNDGNSGCVPGDGTYPCPAGVPWQQIIALPYNATADIEDNSTNDQQLIPDFADQATSIGRPWYLSAWSACLQNNEQDGSDNYTSDADAALHVTDMLNLAAGKPITNYQPVGKTTAPAAGFSFWDLGNQAPTTCEIGPAYAPISFAALTNGPR